MRVWLALLPLIFGASITVYSMLAGDRRELVVVHQVAGLWFGVGLLVSAVLLGVILLRRSLARVAARAFRAGSDVQRENQARFLSRLDHELKNPLTAIRAGLSNLDAQDPVVSSITAQTVRLSGVVTDLRKLAEVRAVELEFAPVDLAALATEVRDSARELPGAADRSVSLGFPRAPRPLPDVRGDYDLLFLALYNLVANAVKYSAAGDDIEIRGAESAGWVTLEVADTGRGIPNDELGGVWEELSRGRESFDQPGSGLGLPFVKAIIERHGGTVALQSRPTEGTLVSVRLPLQS